MSKNFNKTIKLLLENIKPIENQYNYWIVTSDNQGTAYNSTKEDWNRWLQSEKKIDILLNNGNKSLSVRAMSLGKIVMVELPTYFDSPNKVKPIADQILNSKHHMTPSSGSAY